MRSLWEAGPPWLPEPPAPTEVRLDDAPAGDGTGTSASQDGVGLLPQVPPAPEVSGGQPGPRPRVRELLSAYDRALAAVDELPLLVPIRTRHQRPRLWRPLPVLPRPRLLLRTMMAHHMQRMLRTLDRCYHRRAAFGSGDENDDADRAALQHFRAAMPAVHRKTIVTALLVAVLVTSQLLLGPLTELVGTGATVAEGVEADASTETAVEESGSPRALFSRKVLASIFSAVPVSELPGLIETALNATTFEFSTVGALFARLQEAGPRVLAVLVGYLTLIAYVVLRPFAAAFRLKRILFNLHPAPQELLKATTAAWHAPRATGVYAVEADLLDELGWGHAPQEQPFDLVILALPPILLLAPAVAVAVMGASGYATTVPGARAYALGLLVGGLLAAVAVAPCVARLRWLRSVQRARQGERTPQPPRELGLTATGGTVLLRRPQALALAAAAPYLLLSFAPVQMGLTLGGWDGWGATLLFYGVAIPALSLAFTAPWWYRLLRELRDLGRAHGVALGRWPAAAVPWLLISAGVLVTSAASLLYAFAFLGNDEGWVAARVLLGIGVAVLIAGLGIAALPVALLRRRIARAQQLAGLAVTVAPGWLLAPAILILPVMLWHLQRELNAVWARLGEPLIEAPAEASPRVPRGTTPSPRSLPWLRRAALGAAVLLFAGGVLRSVEPAPDQFGDDPVLDGLAERCDRGDEAACIELYWESAWGSDYEAFADERIDWDAYWEAAPES